MGGGMELHAPAVQCVPRAWALGMGGLRACFAQTFEILDAKYCRTLFVTINSTLAEGLTLDFLSSY